MEKFDTPLLKWIGGKTQIINDIVYKFPTNMENYHELFIGGGSVLLALLNQQKNNIITISNNIYAYDYNEPLIHFYKNIQNNPKQFYSEIKKIINDNNSLTEEYYYQKRKEYNNLNNDEKNNIYGSALFLYLNKVGFRGMYRVCKKNNFNIPYGNYKNPTIINEKHLYKISKLIKNVQFIHLSFEKAFNFINNDNDFVYLDPPYVPESKTSSFVNYTKNGFDLNKHIQLFELCNNLNKKNIKFIMSNSNTELVRNNFTNNNYIIEEIEAKRKINSKNPQSKTIELIIKNY